MPEDTLQDFNERSTERRQLSDEISSSLPATKLSPLVWTWCQVCDLDQMRKLAYDELTWNNLYTKDEQPFADKHALDAVKLWMQSLSTKTQTRTATKRSFSDAFHEPTPSSPLQGQYLPIRQEVGPESGLKALSTALCTTSRPPSGAKRGTKAYAWYRGSALSRHATITLVTPWVDWIQIERQDLGDF